MLPFVVTSSPIATIMQTPDIYTGNEAGLLRGAGYKPQSTYAHILNQGQDPPAALNGAIARSPDNAVLVGDSKARVYHLSCAASS